MQQKRQIIYVVVAIVIALLGAASYLLLSKPAPTPEVAPEPVMTPEERLRALQENAARLSPQDVAAVQAKLGYEQATTTTQHNTNFADVTARLQATQ